MNLRRIGPLALAVAIVGLLLGCSNKVNHDPVIESLSATPDAPVQPGSAVTLTVAASDPDGDQLSYEWSATAGTLSASTGTSVTWTAPNDAAFATVTVTVRDDAEGADVETKTVSARAWMRNDVFAYSPDSTYLANPGTSEAVFEFDFDAPFPSGARIDSAFITTDFEPLDELETEVFSVWVVSPTGTPVLVYDGFNLITLDVDDFKLTGIADELADGTWKLRVTRQAKGIEGYADECELTVFYRY